MFRIAVKDALKPFLLRLSLVISAAESASDSSSISLIISSESIAAENAEPVGKEGLRSLPYS